MSNEYDVYQIGISKAIEQSENVSAIGLCDLNYLMVQNGDYNLI